MKKLPIFTAVLCLMALGSSVFAAIVTNETVSGKSGNTINAAYDTSTATQTLTLSGDVTETAVTSLNQTSTITLKSSDSTVRTISANGTDTHGPLPVFGNAKKGATINLSLNNVAVTGRLVAAGSRLSKYSNGTVTVSGSADLTLTGTGTALNDWGGTIFGYNGVTLKDFENVTVTGYKAFNLGGAIFTNGNIEISNIKTLSFQNNEVTGKDDASADGGAIGSLNTVSIHDITEVSFKGNKAIDTSGTAAGGAISGYAGITLCNLDSLTFEENSSSRGGAITSLGTISICNDTTGAVSFKNNTASKFGGAIFSLTVTTGGLEITQNNGTVSFTNNTATLLGGAIINIMGSFAFSGDNSTFTFSGNTANSKPNDIVVGADGSTISGKSTYSFGGGITGVVWDDDVENFVPAQYSLAISGGANVTFESGSITDLGVLTVDASTMTVKAGATSTYTGLTLKNNPTVSFGTYPTRVGKLTLDNTNNVSVSQMTDLLGVATDLTAQNSSVVNLQNGSVDTVKLDGTITISGSTVDLDILSPTSYDFFKVTRDIDLSKLKINIADTGLEAGQTYDLFLSDTSITKDDVTVEFLNSVVGYGLSLENGGKALRLTINSVSPLGPTSNVPEPATWVLLALGMVGLMWGRRFTRR